jgi:hypothetical protein
MGECVGDLDDILFAQEAGEFHRIAVSRGQSEIGGLVADLQVCLGHGGDAEDEGQGDEKRG